jgi:hypothetical protein
VGWGVLEVGIAFFGGKMGKAGRKFPKTRQKKDDWGFDRG